MIVVLIFIVSYIVFIVSGHPLAQKFLHTVI